MKGDTIEKEVTCGTLAEYGKDGGRKHHCPGSQDLE